MCVCVCVCVCVKEREIQKRICFEQKSFSNVDFSCRGVRLGGIYMDEGVTIFYPYFIRLFIRPLGRSLSFSFSNYPLKDEMDISLCVGSSEQREVRCSVTEIKIKM